VSLTLACGEVPVMLALRLFLPENWTSNLGPVGASGCSDRISNGTHEAGDRLGGDRSDDRSRRALWLRAGGCRLWAERAVPPGPLGSQACLLDGRRVPPNKKMPFASKEPPACFLAGALDTLDTGAPLDTLDTGLDTGLPVRKWRSAPSHSARISASRVRRLIWPLTAPVRPGGL
jgi:hypothetical protein